MDGQHGWDGLEHEQPREPSAESHRPTGAPLSASDARDWAGYSAGENADRGQPASAPAQYSSMESGDETAPLGTPSAAMLISSAETTRLTTPPSAGEDIAQLTPYPASYPTSAYPPEVSDARRTDAPLSLAMRPTAPPTYIPPPASPRPAAPATRRLPQSRPRGWRRRALLIGLVLVCFLLGFSGVYAALTIPDALTAARDAKTQAQAIQAIINGGHLTETATLTALQTRLHALDGDLGRIQSNIPGGPVIGVVNSTPPGHALAMARDLTMAGLYAVDAGLVLAPHFKDMIASVTGAAPQKSGKAPGTSPGPLTSAELTRATTDIRTAGQFATNAVNERAHISDGDLQTLGLRSFVSVLHKLDAIAPKAPTYLDYAQRVLAALPTLLGVTKPVNFLVLDLDSDELRPSGGFQGVFGILTLKGGRLTSGVHLKNIYALDCPNGFPPNCAPHPLPSSYNWFTYPDGLRNANLDPNYPASARLDERMLAADHGPAVAGVISLTPVIIQQALTLTGAVAVPGYPQKMTAHNFSELIHYYHSIAGSNNIGSSKAFDAAAGAALLKAVARLSQADQSKLIGQAFGDLRTGDLQVYVNDPQVESVLAALQLDGALRAPAGDTYEVVNTNHGANYANADVTAVQSDHVVINAQGAATHTLTITYKFPVKNHLYTPGLVSVYRDFIQVLAPSRAHLQAIHGCAPVHVTEPGWADFACDLTLWRGATATVTVQWVTPAATVAAAHGATRYDLLVQRQSGSQNGLVVTVTPPAGAHLAQPLAPGVTLTAQGQARYAQTLNQDRALSLTWAS